MALSQRSRYSVLLALSVAVSGIVVSCRSKPHYWDREGTDAATPESLNTWLNENWGSRTNHENTNDWVIPSLEYALTPQQRADLRGAAMNKDRSAAWKLYNYYMAIKRDPNAGRLWLKYLAWCGDPRARRMFDEQRYVPTDDEIMRLCHDD